MERESSLSWLPRTKFLPPKVGEDVLPRRDLIKALRAAILGHRLTLLAAPAGSGKTTTVALLHKQYPELLLVWLMLDADDNDPTGFITLLLAGIERALPDYAQEVRSLLARQGSTGPSPQHTVAALINSILDRDPTPLVLVLDDLHLIQNTAVLDILNYMLEHLPPMMHVVATTRRRPALTLARLRARGQLAEFHLPDLSFSMEETATLLNDQFRLDLSHSALQRIQIQSEGWIAGLHLLASSLSQIERTADRHAFNKQFGQRNRFIFDILAEEVLDRQPVDIRAFLLQTSILPELTPGLCAAVTGRADTEDVLEELLRRNLFLITVTQGTSATAETVYRYHALFAEFLQQRLTREAPEKVTILHRRAADASTVAARAIFHYLAAAAWPEAAAVIEEHGPELLEVGLLDRLQSWLEAIPDGVRERRPWSNYLLAMCYSDRGDFSSALPHLHLAEQQFAAGSDEVGETATLAALAYAYMGLHDFDRVARYLSGLLQRPLSPYEEVRTRINRAWLAVFQNDWDEVDAEVEQAIHIALEADDRGAFNVLAHQLREPLTLGARGVTLIEYYCRTVLERVDEEMSVVHAGSYALLGAIHLLRGELDQALNKARQAAKISRQLGGFSWLEMEVDRVELGFALIRGRYDVHEGYWQERLPSYETTGLRQWLICYLFQRARALWLQDRRHDLRRLAERASVTQVDHEPPESHLFRYAIQSLVSMIDGDPEAAEIALQTAIGLQAQSRQSRFFGDPRLLLARLFRDRRRLQDALAVLKPLLREWAETNTPGWLLQEGHYVIPLLRLAEAEGLETDFARHTLSLMSAEQATRPVTLPGGDEHLTPREVEVLQQIMTGASNGEIAANLVISEWTVKSHVSSILSKMEVASRTEAAARAHELGIPIR